MHQFCSCKLEGGLKPEHFLEEDGSLSGPQLYQWTKAQPFDSTQDFEGSDMFSGSSFNRIYVFSLLRTCGITLAPFQHTL